MTKKAVTAAELMATLEADPEFVAKRGKDDEARQRRADEWQRAEAPLVDDLRAAGFMVESARDLVNTSASYSEAVPILLAHLARRGHRCGAPADYYCSVRSSGRRIRAHELR